MPIPQLKLKKTWEQKPASRKLGQKIWKYRQKIIAILVILGALLSVVVLSLVVWISRDLPSPNQLIDREIAQSTKIYDRKGEHVLYEIHGDQKRTLVALEEIPLTARQASIAIEDKNFYKHGGFSVWAMARTAITNVIYNRSAGGSTLTQQFIKNAVLTNEKTVTRKVKELVLAQRIEKKFSKDEILQMYLNEIPYGSNAYGIEAASLKYFNKSVKDTTLAEQAVLAALPQSPSRYSPYGQNLETLLGRKDYILDLMVEQNYISTEQRDEAKQQEIVFQKPEISITAPHFVMYVKSLLSEKYGETTIEQGGLKIFTTIDYDKQKIAESVVTEKSKDFLSKWDANNAALVAIDPKTGQVLAMVGSRDYFDSEIDGQVNVTTSLRQPGSSMKPIVYASLFEKGYTPNTILYDVVTNFSTDSSNPYIPHNYDLREHGPVSIRKALAGSLNIPAVKAIYLTGIKNVINLAQSLGYSSLNNPDDYGLSLVLGGGEVKLLEHTNAFSAFARDGQISPLNFILKVEDKDGNILEEYKDSNKKVLTSKTARSINSILSDKNARAYVFGTKNYLTLSDRQVAVKTGTTNDYHDAWTVGYTPSLVVGVWVGNTDNKAMKRGADGSVLAAPIWNEFMKTVLTGTPVETFKEPENTKTGKNIIDGVLPLLGKVSVDNRTGSPSSINTPIEFIEYKDVYDHHSILYYVDKNDPLNSDLSSASTDYQFNLWEDPVLKWAIKNNQVISSTTNIFPDWVDSVATTTEIISTTTSSTTPELISTTTIEE